MAHRTCPCEKPAVNHKGPPRCQACRVERVRLAQLRYRDKDRGSSHRGMDEPACIWCGANNNPRAHEVLSPKRFCSDKCKNKFRDEQNRLKTRLTRTCCRCGAPPTNRTGIPYCDACRTQAKREQARARVLRVYGITADDYDRKLGEQQGKCAVCRTTDPGHGHKVFVVDHDHASGHVRGLLCRNCNSAIGLLQDDPKVIAAAAAYVKRHRQMPLFT